MINIDKLILLGKLEKFWFKKIWILHKFSSDVQHNTYLCVYLQQIKKHGTDVIRICATVISFPFSFNEPKVGKYTGR